MPKVTDIKPQKRQNRFNIYIDGEFAFGLDSDNLIRSKLKIEQDIAKDEVEKLIEANEFQKILDRTLVFFSYRPRSEKELDDWFTRKQVGEQTKQMVKKRLASLDLINDEEFAKWWIEQRISFRQIGGRVLKLELRQKGVSEEIIVKLLDCYIDKDTELELARKVVQKKLRSIKSLPVLNQKRKLMEVLARRGFSWKVIKDIIDEIDDKS